jgi:hypothetical protein
MVGEIHVYHPELIPNSRRDDFVDNEMKTLFYNEVEKEVGLPISKEIRLRSRVHSDAKRKVSNKGDRRINVNLPNVPQRKPLDEKDSSRGYNSLTANKLIAELSEICGGCPKFPVILGKLME